MDRSVTVAAGLVILAVIGGFSFFALAVPDDSEGAPALLSGGEQSQAGEMSFEGSSGEEETVALTSEVDLDAFGEVEEDLSLDTATAAAEEKGTIVTLTGRVVDEGGRPVADALVTFSEGGMRGFRGMWSGREDEGEDSTTYTDRDGVFLLEAELEPRRRGEEELPSFLSSSDRVVLSHVAFATMARALGSTAQRESEHDLGTFVMADGATVSGRAVDELGQPLKDTVVSAENKDPEARGSWFRSFRPGLEQFLQDRTESDGRFVISGLLAGEAAVTARRDDRALGVVEALSLMPGVVKDVGDVVLQPGAFIEGKVMDEQGRAVVGASIRVSSMARVAATHQNGVGQNDRRSLGHEWRLRAETDDRGTFRIAGMSEGIYNVHAEAEGYAEARKENVSTGSRNVALKVEGLGDVLLVVTNGLDGERVHEVDVVPERSPWDRGDDEDGPNFLVGPAIPEAALADMAGMSEDLTGLVLVQGVSRDGMEVSLLANGFARSAASLPGVGPGKVVRFDAALVPESVVRGRVVNGAGESVEDARVRFNEQMVQTLSEEDGGRRGGRSGRSNRNVSQTIRRGGPSGDGSEVRTDRLGHFEIRGIAAGTWMLTADARDFARSDALEVSVADSQVIENIEIVILVAGSISGLVTDSRGAPLGEVDVSVEPLEESSGGFNPEDWGRRFAERMMGGGSSRNVRTDSQGAFRVDELAPGLYTVGFAESGGIAGHQGMLVAMAGGGATDNDDGVTAEVESGVETEVLLVKPDGARVEGRVLAGGQLVEGATVRLSQASQGGFDFRRMMRGGGERVVTDVFGRFVFEDAEVGEMELSATVPGSALPETALVETASGTTARADIFFDGATLSGRIVDKETGAPVPDLTVTIAPVSGGAPTSTSEVSMSFSIGASGGGPSRNLQFNSSRGGSESTVRTDGKGTFEVRYVKPGEWTVRTGPSAYVSATSDSVSVTEGSTPREVVMKVDRGAVLEGKVFEGISGNVMSGMMVRLQGDAGRARMESTGEMGGYRFEGLDGGAYTLSVMGSGWGSGALAQEEVMLELGEIQNLDVATSEEPIEEEDGSSFGFFFGR
ncbi:MAG: carboxypeptidase regulatory-like domain-containing protein [Planctomycetota bacterium]|nr:carboxypeptidase regulatory-like domain-containing protein [Planctomycetota bacterium]